MRHKARTDANQPDIVKAFRGLGCSVEILSTLGGGMTDLVIGLPGVNVLVEVKDGSKPPSARELTPDQQDFHANWKGPISIIKDLQGVETLVRWMRKVSNLLIQEGLCLRAIPTDTPQTAKEPSQSCRLKGGTSTKPQACET